VLKDVEEISVVRLGQSDVIRHRLVKRIIEAFDKAEIEEKNRKEQLKEDKK
jgi:phosphate starvation-inducible PhoH-like protein